MELTELRQKSSAELSDVLAAKRERLVELRLSARQKKLKNVREIPTVKKDIARVLTLIHQV